MYILTQNKKMIMEFGRIEISTNFTMKKEEKYALVASGRGMANPTVVGTYPSEKVAMAELRSIFMAINSEQPIYEVR